MTKVSGLEVFGIAPGLLAEELQKSCASSTSVGQLAGSSPRNPVGEVLVQGPQRDAVVKAVERRGVKRSGLRWWIRPRGRRGRWWQEVNNNYFKPVWVASKRYIFHCRMGH